MSERNHYQYYAQKDGKIKDILINKGFSSRLISTIKRGGKLLLNGKPVRFVDHAKEGDVIDVYLPEEHIDHKPVEGNLDIVYEDDEVIIVNKPTLLVTHPTHDYLENTLANWIAYYFEKTGQNVKIRFVNRLDRDTTGLIVVAKNQFVHHYIQSRMPTNEVQKTYLAYTDGRLEPESGEITFPIYRPTKESIERVVDERGQPSQTNYRVLEQFDQASKVECELKTGRTHQIRVHLKAMGTPLIGDPLYNPKTEEDNELGRQALHAYKLVLPLPKTGRHEFIADLPTDLIELENKLREN